MEKLYEASIKDAETNEVLVKISSYSESGLEEEMGKSKWINVRDGEKCGECDTWYKKGEDARVDAGMKCGRCAYSAEDPVLVEGEDNEDEWGNPIENGTYPSGVPVK